MLYDMHAHGILYVFIAYNLKIINFSILFEKNFDFSKNLSYIKIKIKIYYVKIIFLYLQKEII